MAAKNGDLNGDVEVDAFDLSILLDNWNTSSTTADINEDGTVDAFDLSVMLNNWGVVSAPSAPANFTATASEGEVTLGWDAVQYVDSYTVKRGTTSGSYTDLATGVTTTDYTDSTVTNGTTYFYTVAAVNTAGEGANATEASATPEDVTAPATPTGLAATAGDTEVDLSWDANSEPDLDHYTIYRDSVELTTVVAGTTTYTDTGRTNGTQYSYTISASDATGNESNQSTAVTATPEDVTAPATPTGLAATAGDTEVDLSWDANVEPDLADYKLYRDGTLLATIAAGTTTYTDTGLTNGTQYSYTISATDEVPNESAQSTAVTATPVDSTPPAIPTNLAATPGDGDVVLTWDANTEPDLDHYTIYRDSVELTTVAAGTETHTDTTVTNGTQYSYTISASDATGNESNQSTAVTATPNQAGVYLDPATATVSNGNNLIVRVMVDSGANDHDTVQVRLQYDPAKFTYSSFSDAASNYDTSAPGETGADYVEVVRGNTATLTGSQVFGDFTFQAVDSSGTTPINFVTAETLVIHSGTGLSVGTADGSYTLTA